MGGEVQRLSFVVRIAGLVVLGLVVLGGCDEATVPGDGPAQPGDSRIEWDAHADQKPPGDLPRDSGPTELGASEASAPDQSVAPPWVTFAGDPTGGWAYGLGLHVDGKGNSYVAGRFTGTVKFGSTTLKAPIVVPNGADSAFVTKLDTKGNFVWAVQLAVGAGTSSAWAVAADSSGNVYVAGSFKGTASFGTHSFKSQEADGFVTRLDPKGKVVWAVSGSAHGYDTIKSVKLDGSGNLYLAGQYEGKMVFDAFSLNSEGKRDLFVARMAAATGKALWVVSSKGSGEKMGATLALDKPSNRICICGKFSGVAIFGAKNLEAVGKNGPFASWASLVVGLDSSGKVAWASQGKGAYNSCSGITVDKSGNTYITGENKSGAVFGGTTLAGGGWRLYVAKLDPSGKFLWATNVGKGSGYSGPGIAIDGAGNVLATGEILAASGMSDIIVAKLTSKGSVIRTITAGSIFDDIPRGIVADGAGNIYTAGFAFYDRAFKVNSGTVTFDKKVYPVKGRAHMFVWKRSAF